MTEKEHAFQVRNQSRGFTLIELVIVVVIITLGAGLIGPLSLKELNKSRAKVEFLELRNTLKTATTRAYARGFGYQVVLTEKSLSLTSANGRQIYNYEYITLPELSFYINSNGFPSVNSLMIVVGKKRQIMNMTDMLGVNQGAIDAEQN